MKRNLLLLVTLAALGATAAADVVTFKNGDRLTGAIVKADDKTLVLETKAMGPVSIAMAEVDTIQSDQPYISIRICCREVNIPYFDFSFVFKYFKLFIGRIIIDQSLLALYWNSRINSKIYSAFGIGRNCHYRLVIWIKDP